MKAMFPTTQSSGLSASGRALLIGGGAVIVAAALVLYRGEVRSEVNMLLGRDEPKPAVVLHHHPAMQHQPPAPVGARPSAAGAPATAASAAQKPGQPADANAKPGQVAAVASTAPANTKPGQPAAAPNGAKPAAGPVGVKGAVAAAQNAAAAANQHLAAAQNTAAPASSTPAPVMQAGRPAAPATTSRPAKDTSRVIMREVFSYEQDARRDPFYSLINSGELRPGVADLRLMGILYDESGRRPVAIFRDVTSNAQYRVTTGQQLGRMRVAEIKRKVVLFTIEEFGMNRQDSLVLGDTTKARAR